MKIKKKKFLIRILYNSFQKYETCPILAKEIPKLMFGHGGSKQISHVGLRFELVEFGEKEQGTHHLSI